ncbi:MAG: hypothetical protein KC561_19075, partial [Myxococcales bacterium]|nr:hypothetical protein [Myxococcales bacterium]
MNTRHLLCLGAFLCASLVLAYSDESTPPVGQIQGDVSSGRDSTVDNSSQPDMGEGDLTVGPDLEGTADISEDIFDPHCPTNTSWNGEECTCDSGWVSHPDQGCVRCTENAHCGGRVCAGFSCRNCLSNAECGEGMYCGTDGRCTEQAPTCTDEGEQRCSNHQFE